MSYTFTGNLVHEIIGTMLLLFFLIHIVLHEPLIIGFVMDVANVAVYWHLDVEREKKSTISQDRIFKFI